MRIRWIRLRWPCRLPITCSLYRSIRLTLPEVPVESLGDPNFPPPDWVLNGPAYVINLAGLLLDGTPHYNWPDFVDGSDQERVQGHQMIKHYIAYLMKLPAFQLT